MKYLIQHIPRSLLLVALLVLFFSSTAVAQPPDYIQGVPVRIFPTNVVIGSGGFVSQINPPAPAMQITYSSGGTMYGMLPGQVYTLYWEAYNASADLVVAPPPGYRVVMNGLCRNSCFMNGWITVQIFPTFDIPQGAAGYASTIAGGHIDWRVSLGNLLDGSPAGSLELVSPGNESSWSALYTPAALSYEATSSEVFTYQPSNTLRQIIANQVAMDIVTLNSTSYEIRCYNPVQAQSYVPCSFSGSPFVVYRVSQGTSATSLVITRETRNITDPNTPMASVPIVRSETMTLTRTGTAPTFQWQKTDWTVTGQTALAVTAISGAGTTASRSETITTAANSGAPADSQLLRQYSVLSCGEVVTGETLGTTNPTSAVFDYYSNLSTSGNFGYLQDVTSNNGNWMAYDYYDTSNYSSMSAGTVKYSYAPYGNYPAAPVHDPGQGKVTYYEYTADPFGFNDRPTLVQTTINSVMVAKTSVTYGSTLSMVGSTYTYVVVATKTESTSNSASTHTIEDFVPEDNADQFFRGKTTFMSHPSGAAEGYTYEKGSWDGAIFTPSTSTPYGGLASRITVIKGSNNSSAGTSSGTYETVYLVEGKSTKETSIREDRGLLVRTEKYVWSSGAWALIQWTNHNYNYYGLETSTAASDGTTTSKSYDGLLLASATDATGVVTSYTYDAAGRVQISTQRAGALGSLATHYAYNAAGLQTETRVGWGQTEQLLTRTGYDDSGRKVSVMPPGLGETTIAYDVPNRMQTTTRPDGGTTIQTSALDGTPLSKTGTCVIPEYYVNGVESDGRTYQTVYTGSATSPRWSKTWTDWAGRTIQTSHPGYTGQPDVVATSVYDATSGLLTETTKTGYAPTYYSYDYLGGLFRTGLDVDSNGGLVLGSNDRIQEVNQYFELSSGSWWHRKDTISYLTNGSATATTLAISRKRLTGFPAGVVADSSSTDVEGNVTESQTAVNLLTAVSATTTTSTGLTDPEVDMTVAGLAVSQTTHDQLTTTTNYDGLWRPHLSTDSRGNPATTAYVAGTTQVYTVTDATAAVVTTNNYDPTGHKIWSHDAAGHYTRLAYNARDQVTNQWGDGAIPLSYTYDPAYGDKLTMSTYRGGAGWDGPTWPTGAGSADTTTWTYDGPSGLQLSKADPVNPAVTQTYNIRGQTNTRTLSRGTVATYGYDGSTGELTSTIYSDSTPSLGYTYNRQGKMSTVTDATGSRTLAYDSTHPWRFLTENLSTYFGSKVITRLYSASQVLGRVNGFQLGLSSSANADLGQTYGFTADGRFETLTTSRNADAYSRSFKYGYLPSSALVKNLTIAGSPSFEVNRTFETNRDYMLSVETDWGAVTESRFDYVTNALGQRSSRIQSGQAFADYGNSTLRSYGYDARGELTSAPEYLGTTVTTSAQMPSRQDSYSYDNIGNRTSVNRTTNSGLAETYTVNSLNQYVSKENNSLLVSGTADPAANVAVAGSTSLAGRQGNYWATELAVANTSSPWTGSPTAYAGKVGAGISGADLIHVIARIGKIPPMTQSFTYDTDGNLTADGMWTYTWDGENRLTQMQASTAAATAGLPNYQISFVYDYLGRRVQKRVTDLGASGAEVSSLRYVYDGWNLIAEFTAPAGTTFGALIRSYTWGLDIARSLTDAGGVGALVQIADQASGKNFLPGYDGNGNVVVLLNADSGALAADYEYDPFGQTLRSDERDSAATNQPFRFSTKYRDLETGLYYYGHRYYAPNIGRFVNRDPIEESGGINLYGFCGNDSVNRWDLLGMWYYLVTTDQFGSPLSSTPVFDGTDDFEGYFSTVVYISFSGSNANTGNGTNGNGSNKIPVPNPASSQLPVTPFSSTFVGPVPVTPATYTPGDGNGQAHPISSVFQGFAAENEGFYNPLFYDARPDYGADSHLATPAEFGLAAMSYGSSPAPGQSPVGVHPEYAQSDLIADLKLESGLNTVNILAHGNAYEGPQFAHTVLDDPFFSAVSAALSPTGSRTVNFISCSAFADPTIQGYLAYYADKYNLTLVGANGILFIDDQHDSNGNVTGVISANPGVGLVKISPGPNGQATVVNSSNLSSGFDHNDGPIQGVDPDNQNNP